MEWRLPAAAIRTWVFASRREKQALSLLLPSPAAPFPFPGIEYGNMRALERVLLRGFPSAAESPRWKQSEAASAAGKPGRAPSLLLALPACLPRWLSAASLDLGRREEGRAGLSSSHSSSPPFSSFPNTSLGFDAAGRENAPAEERCFCGFLEVS